MSHKSYQNQKQWKSNEREEYNAFQLIPPSCLLKMTIELNKHKNDRYYVKKWLAERKDGTCSWRYINMKVSVCNQKNLHLRSEIGRNNVGHKQLNRSRVLSLPGIFYVTFDLNALFLVENWRDRHT